MLRAGRSGLETEVVVQSGQVSGLDAEDNTRSRNHDHVSNSRTADADIDARVCVAVTVVLRLLD
jgi:hypothetical protein